MSKIVGIDLGTSTSEVALLVEGSPVVISNPLGEKITPSVVGISEDGARCWWGGTPGTSCCSGRRIQ